MKWKNVRLGDIADFSNGINFDKSAYGNGVRMINVADFQDYFSPCYDALEEIDERVVRKNDYLKEDDIVFVRSNGNKALVGRCMIIKNPIVPVTFSGFCIRCRIKNADEYDPLFMTYYFKTLHFRQSISGNAVGANIQNLSQGRLSNHIAHIPDITEQKRIATILYTYEQMIESNQKQIKLLEEAAQRLYKEWFVDFRFPGYEDTPIVDGVPEGWEKHPFSQKVSIMSGGTPRTDNKEYYDGTIPFYSPKDSNNDFFAYDTFTHISQTGLENCNSKLYPKGTIIITARGTVGKTTILATEMAMNQSCYALKCATLDLPYYLFFSLRQEVEKLKQMANGGVFDTIIIKTFDNIHLLFPSNGTAQMFERVVTPFMESIQTKLKYVMELKRARDSILPRIMNGEIEV